MLFLIFFELHLKFKLYSLNINLPNDLYLIDPFDPCIDPSL